MAQPTAGMGTTLGYSTNGVAYTTIQGVKSISGPSPSVDFADTTALDAPGGFEQKIPTIFRGGEWEIELIYFQAQHIALNTIFAARTPVLFKATFTDSGTVTASGYLGALSRSVDAADALMTSMTFNQSGPLTVA